MSDFRGRIVRIMTFCDSGAPSNEFWWAAVDDDREAIRAVSLAAGAKADQGLTVEGVLDPSHMRATGLALGQVMRANPSPIG